MKLSKGRVQAARLAGLAFVTAILAASFDGSRILSAQERAEIPGKEPLGPLKTPVIDGSFVHNVGDLQMNITNWGILGSMPKSNYPMNYMPSATYPAGSGNEYLYAAGIWVGALKNGIPCVSTGYPETEFRPAKDSWATIYRTFEGDLRGHRYPGPADDDGDGLVDEDFLNGYDDDGDGLIDEDFAAIGSQMFSCEYFDNIPEIQLIWPEHVPLGIRVRQETFQWGEPLYYDFINMRFTITNVGNEYLTNVYVGLYADLDAGPRTWGSYFMDDKVSFYSGSWCARRNESQFPVKVNIVYVYDADGDRGVTPGYFGIVYLGQTTTVNGWDAPRYPSLSIVDVRKFQGLQPYANGGEPTNDYERYEVLSTYGRDIDAQTPGDYRVLISSGPFMYLAPETSIHVDVAFVAGDGFDGMMDNAAQAVYVYRGIWYDMDGDPKTGVDGRESPVIGPLKEYDPDYCDSLLEKLTVNKYETCWSNLDCQDERFPLYDRTCYLPAGDSWWNYATGVGGKEYNLHWVTGAAPTPPNIRAVAGDGFVSIIWDDLSETTPDPMTLKYDFEGYQVWRADDWHRPIGSSESTGPSMDLWSILDSGDEINGILPDKDNLKPESQGGWIYDPLPDLDGRDDYIAGFETALMASPGDPPPRPPELTSEQCDTLEAIARRDLGLEGGKRYYRYTDWTAKDGLPYFYSVTAYDHTFKNGKPYKADRFNSPAVDFVFVSPRSDAQEAATYDEDEIIVVPNPVTSESLQPWTLGQTNYDASGLKVEFRNLPRCRSKLRIFTVSGDLVIALDHDGTDGNGTAAWNLVSRNGQEVTSGVYLFAVEPEDSRFKRFVGKFVVIR